MAGLLERADGLARLLAQPHLIWLVSFSRAGLAIMLGDLDDAEQERTGPGPRRHEQAAGWRRWPSAWSSSPRSGGSRAVSASWARACAGPPRNSIRSTLPLRYLVELRIPPAASPVLDEIVATSGLIPRRDPAERAALDNLALAAARLNRRDLADPLYAALEPFAATFGHSAVGHHCGHYYLAHLAVTREDADRAAAHFAAAAELHERRGVPLLLAESLLDWADAIDRGQAGRAPPGGAAGPVGGDAGRAEQAGQLEQRVRLGL